MKNFKLSLLLTLLILIGCGSNDIKKESSSSLFSTQEKEFVHNLFLTEYLWYDQVPLEIDYTTVKTPNSLIDRLRVTPPDRWSFSITKKEYESFANQKTEGFGFGYTPEFIIFLIRINSPVYGKLKRGDKIISINGKVVSDQNIQRASSRLNSPTTFTVQRDGEELQIEVTPKTYNFKVAQGKILNVSNKKVGYLRYDSFSSSSVAEFEEAFTLFKNANVSELVIDLRYNGGGSVAVASALLDNITNKYAGKKQFYLDWNDNYKQQNEDLYFSNEVESNDLNMKRVFFLVTKNSASASELVISALKPYLGNNKVITIGTATHGKNVGMAGRVYGENYYFLIDFYVKNSKGETTSFNGIPATCLADDDIGHSMGDTQEAMLSSALYFITHNQCP